MIVAQISITIVTHVKNVVAVAIGWTKIR